MMRFAFDLKGLLVSARSAEKGKNYQCPECKEVVRSRSGLQRQPHFFHAALSSSCRQNGKSPLHWAIQHTILGMLPQAQAFLEYRFNAISRIADVAWLEERLVFEIQCSPITLEEVKNRTQDYASIGWCPIWILHTKQFGKANPSAAEIWLENWPHYFTNLNLQGEGIIFDLASKFEGPKRINLSPPLTISLLQPRKIFPHLKMHEIPMLLETRLKRPILFKGDLMDRWILERTDSWDFLIDEKHPEKKESKFLRGFKKLKEKGALGYRILLNYLLENATRVL